MDKSLKINSNPSVAEKISSYPPRVQKKLNAIRKLILDTAKKTEGLSEIEETLKWGEPSYLVKKGSTLRMDWKAKAPDQYAVYFKCTSKLVETFKKVHGDLFQYQNNRAMIFQMNDKVPKKELSECIKTTLRYHHVKNLPSLGMLDL